jgi:hypothetical protein
MKWGIGFQWFNLSGYVYEIGDTVDHFNQIAWSINAIMLRLLCVSSSPTLRLE